MLGVVDRAYAPGESAEVKTAFPLAHAGWAWAPGPVFLGLAGQLTQVLPPGALFRHLEAPMLRATLPGAALAFWLFGLSLPALTLGGLTAGLGMAGMSTSRRCVSGCTDSLSGRSARRRHALLFH